MRRRPIVLFFVFWTAGMALQAYAQWTWPGLAWSVGFSALWGLIFFLRFRYRSLIGYMLVAAVALNYYAWYDGKNVSSVLLAENHTAVELRKEKAIPIEQKSEWSVSLSGKIASPVEVDGDRVNFVVQTAEITLDSTLRPIEEKVQVNVRLLTKDEQDRAHAWGRGDRISLQGILRQPSLARNFGGFDYRRYLYFQHVHWIVSVKGASSVIIDPVSGWGTERWMRWNDELRNRLGKKIETLFDQRQDGFMKGLILGLGSEVETERFRQFSQLGLTHILAVSGLHVAVFVGVCLGFMRLAGTARETGLIVCMMLLPFYVLLTGAAPSIMRAGLMGMIALYAARRNWMHDGLHLVSIVGFLMLLWDPYYLFDVSFQLSFIVTIGLIVGVPRFNRLIAIKPKILGSAISVTTVAQLVSFPLTIYYFNQFSPLSWLANLLMVPLFSSVVLPLGALAMVTGFVSDSLGQGIAWLTSRINDFLFGIVDRLIAWDGWRMIWPSPPIWWIGLYFVMLTAIYWSLELWKNAGKDRHMFYISAGCFILLLAFAYRPDGLSRHGEISFIDVGQGDAILIRTPEHKTILIDGGGTLLFEKPGEEWKRRKDPYEVGQKLLVPLLLKRGVQRIDYLITTHGDADHIGGLQAVVERIPVRYVLFNGTVKQSVVEKRLLAALIKNEIPILPVSDGMLLQADSDTKFRFIFPFETGELEKGALDMLTHGSKQNKQSIVTLMEMERKTFLFTGDVEATEEKTILSRINQSLNSGGREEGEKDEKIAVDVLKVAHHGSKTSTSEEWLRYWTPVHSVISVGERNVYGHPNEQVLDRLKKANSNILRTDRNGEVRFVLRDGMLSINTALSSSD